MVGETLGEVDVDGFRVGTRVGDALGSEEGIRVGVTEGDAVCAVKYAIQMVHEGRSLCSPTARVKTVSPVVWSVSSSAH